MDFDSSSGWSKKFTFCSTPASRNTLDLSRFSEFSSCKTGCRAGVQKETCPGQNFVIWRLRRGLSIRELRVSGHKNPLIRLL
ncbi:MAG: hypothetical protein LUF92_14955 [Clostridiales bacterium]|nr:hypothetical protein [Clostridiales bacterium]